MTWRTHLLGGLLATQAVGAGMLCGTAQLPAYAAFLAAGAIGGLVPDIDHQDSKISRSNIGTRLTSKIIVKFFRHRGVIHTPAFLCLLAAALAAVCWACSRFGFSFAWTLLLGFVLGYLSHLFLDTFNRGGIMWLWPITKRRFHLASIRVNGGVESFITVILLAVNIGLSL